jgi:hypothetical protein
MNVSKNIGRLVLSTAVVGRYAGKECPIQDTGRGPEGSVGDVKEGGRTHGCRRRR